MAAKDQPTRTLLTPKDLLEMGEEAVEVISPEVKYGYLQRKIRDYFEAGVRLLWIVDPEMQTVTVYHSPIDLRVLTAAGALSGEDVLPGFSYHIAELFEGSRSV